MSRRAIQALVLAVSCLWATTATAQLSVMTRNLYLGADLTPVFASDAATFPAEAAAALNQVAQNNFPRRARALAREVARTRPHVIGLQEAFRFSVGGATLGVPFVDMLEVFEQALAARGLNYVRVAVVPNIDLNIPAAAVPGLGGDLGVLDRDVILVRGDVAGSAEPLPPGSGTYDCIQPVGDGCRLTPGVPLPATLIPFSADPFLGRGIVVVELSVAGELYRVANTHLEVRLPDPTNPASAGVQSFQAQAVAMAMGQLAGPNHETILIGDINSAPDDAPIEATDPMTGDPIRIIPPYQILASSNLIDAWTRNFLIFFNPDGATCCQQPDLANFQSQLDERIDQIWVHNRRFAALAIVTGERRLFGVPRWSSDHGGVFGLLFFP